MIRYNNFPKIKVLLGDKISIFLVSKSYLSVAWLSSSLPAGCSKLCPSVSTEQVTMLCRSCSARSGEARLELFGEDLIKHSSVAPAGRSDS